LVAPASGFDRPQFEAGVEELRALGFVPVWNESVFEREIYTAGSAGVRTTAIDAAWQDDSIAGLIGVRGGYGSAQLLPLLDREEVRRARKPLVGYSDLTSVLNFLTLCCGLVSFHGPMLAGRLAALDRHHTKLISTGSKGLERHEDRALSLMAMAITAMRDNTPFSNAQAERTLRQIRMPLKNVERAAEDIGERARLLDVPSFEIHGDHQVRAKKESAFDGHRRGQKSVDECASVVLDRYEQARIGARSANHGGEGPVRIVDGYSCVDIGGSY
jgi:hypothetical protein